MMRLALPLALLIASPAAGQAMPAPAPMLLSAPIVTAHGGTFNGRRVVYDAAVEGFDATDLAGKPTARLVAISYVARAARADRPVLFVFNGGPISPSAILHMGAFGPKRVAVPEDVAAPPDRFRLVDNPHSPLDVADIVFFDPAGTGFSRTAPGVDPTSQFSVAADARQLEQLVLAWTRAHGREASPVYLVGESYGTIRAPAAAGQLAEAGRPPAGVILLGQAVNIVEYSQRRGNILSYVVSLPTLAAIAWWHDKADRQGRDFEQFMAQARTFAAGEYLGVLFQGAAAPPARREAAARQLQAFTGIAADYWLGHALRMTKVDYQRALFPGERLGTNDARYRGPATGPDPFDVVPASFYRFFDRYLAGDLGAGALGGYVTDSPVTGGFNGWDYGRSKTPFGDWPYAQPLTDLFARQPHFRLFVANGYYDTQTTTGAMDYLVAQSGWPRDRVRSTYYEGGHMPYTVEASLKQFAGDVRAMVTGKW